MPKTFAITVANNVLSLDAQGRGEAAFTVSNLSKRSLRGRARIIPLAGAKADWFSLDGEAEREFPIDGTQQFTVRVAVPPGTSPGQPSFRLDTAATDNPDELFAEGPTAGFEIKTPAPPVKSSFPWWIVAAVAAVCVIGGLAAWWFSRPAPGKTLMPGLVNLTPDEAQKTLKDKGIMNKTSVEVLPAEGGAFGDASHKIVATSPKESEPIAADDTIRLLVLPEGVTIPSMKTATGWFSVAEASAKLSQLTVKGIPGVPEGLIVYDTEPPVGKSVAVGSTVTIATALPMPKLVGSKVNDAVNSLHKALSDKGMDRVISTQFAEKYDAESMVTETNPAAEEPIKPAQAISFKVSKAGVLVPKMNKSRIAPVPNTNTSEVIDFGGARTDHPAGGNVSHFGGANGVINSGGVVTDHLSSTASTAALLLLSLRCNLAEAEQKLTAVGLRVGQKFPANPRGVVQKTDPKEGDAVAPGSAVNLYFTE